MRHEPLNEFLEMDASVKHHPPAFIAICHHQQQEPSWTFSCDATVVLVRETWFVHRSDSLVLTFWQLEFSLNERDVAPTSLPQPSVGLFPDQVDEPPQLRQLRPISLPHDHTDKSRSESIATPFIPSVAALTTAANSDSPLLKAHAFTNRPPHIAIPPTVAGRLFWAAFGADKI